MYTDTALTNDPVGQEREVAVVARRDGGAAALVQQMRGDSIDERSEDWYTGGRTNPVPDAQVGSTNHSELSDLQDPNSQISMTSWDQREYDAGSRHRGAIEAFSGISATTSLTEPSGTSESLSQLSSSSTRKQQNARKACKGDENDSTMQSMSGVEAELQPDPQGAAVQRDSGAKWSESVAEPSSVGFMSLDVFAIDSVPLPPSAARHRGTSAGYGGTTAGYDGQAGPLSSSGKVAGTTEHQFSRVIFISLVT